MRWDPDARARDELAADEDAQLVRPCPACGAQVGQRCINRALGRPYGEAIYHPARRRQEANT